MSCVVPEVAWHKSSVISGEPGIPWSLGSSMRSLRGVLPRMHPVVPAPHPVERTPTAIRALGQPLRRKKRVLSQGRARYLRYCPRALEQWLFLYTYQTCLFPGFYGPFRPFSGAQEFWYSIPTGLLRPYRGRLRGIGKAPARAPELPILWAQILSFLMIWLRGLL